MAVSDTSVPGFLAGGGELGELTRQYHWVATTLGSPNQWPPSLQTILGVILHAQYPMFLWWGPDLIQFYNDAYRPVLSSIGKHPTALGQRGEDAWPERWPLIKPLIDQVLTGGEAIWGEDLLLPLNRYDRLENVYWRFSYSPVWGEAGQVAGVLVVGQEATRQILSLQEDHERYQFALESAQFGLWEVDLATNVVHWDERCNALFGGDSIANASPWEETIKTIHPDDVGQVMERAQRAMDPRSGGYYDATYRVISPDDGRLRWARFTGQAYFNTEGKPYRFRGAAQNVTKEVEIQRQIEASAAKLEMIFDKAPVGIAIVRGPELVFELANERYHEIMGRFEPDSLIDRAFADALPEFHELFQMLLDVMHAGRTSVVHEHKIDVLLDGHRKRGYFNLVFEPLYDHSDPAGVFITAAEVTNSVVIRHSIEANEAYLQRIFGHVSVSIFITHGIDFVIEMVNPVVCAFWGRSREQVLGKPFFDALPEIAELGFEEVMAGVLQTGQPFVGTEMPTKINRQGQPKRFYIDLAIEPLSDSDGRINRIVHTVTDVTDRVLARQLAEKLLAEQRELNEFKSNFVTLASHEFRTPMTTILSSAVLIRSYNNANDKAKSELHVQRIESAVYSLTNLLDVFLSLSQMEQQTLHSEPYPLNIRLFCEEVVEDMEGVIKPGQRVVYQHLAGEATQLIDGQLLRSILINLLVNASKYSADEKKIELTTSTLVDQLEITVKDEGIGIPDADKNKLFVNFFRARNVTHVPGTGLGLYVVKRYVDLLGGRIAFTSQLDSGTTFTVQIPLSLSPLST